MKSLLIALLLATFICPPVLAETYDARRTYKKYHYFVYYPVMVVTFLIAGPIILLSNYNQHVEDKLNNEADLEELNEKLKEPRPTSQVDTSPIQDTSG